ncbi:unnamed protein product [Schistosoma curassoni]|uniref:Uncharacterized protein n=1 Tax=Schistosoma curassoni TaxID=6186 RepID=A0A183KRB1_9TREM|nr:unnamed protein product [Schistosoma curassoni]
MIEMGRTRIYTTTEIHTMWKPNNFVTILISYRQSVQFSAPQ